MSRMSLGIHKIEMFAELFYEHSLPEVYGAYSYAGKAMLPNEKSVVDRDGVYSIRLVPNYLHLTLKNPLSTLKKIKQLHLGYAIFLEKEAHPDQYVKQRFGSNAKTIRRYVNRLEACFNVSYKMFYGAMDYETYVFTMNSLRQMLVKRFQQRNTTNSELHIWQEVVESTYSQILERKASLFVIYNESTPIEISLNYHFDSILFSSTSSYDIDYAKFGLGHVEIYKQIEWCLANAVQIFEMGDGELDYKRRWSNAIYNFEHHVIYPKNSWVKSGIAQIEIGKIKLREYLKSKNIQIQGFKIRYVPKPKKASSVNNNAATGLQYEVVPIDNFEQIPVGSLIDYNTTAYTFLRKIVYDFLYTHTEHISAVQVLEITRHKEYFLKGKTKAHKVIITSKINPGLL